MIAPLRNNLRLLYWFTSKSRNCLNGKDKIKTEVSSKEKMKGFLVLLNIETDRSLVHSPLSLSPQLCKSLNIHHFMSRTTNTYRQSDTNTQITLDFSTNKHFGDFLTGKHCDRYQIWSIKSWWWQWMSVHERKIKHSKSPLKKNHIEPLRSHLLCCAI